MLVLRDGHNFKNYMSKVWINKSVKIWAVCMLESIVIELCSISTWNISLWSTYHLISNIFLLWKVNYSQIGFLAYGEMPLIVSKGKRYFHSFLERILSFLMKSLCQKGIRALQFHNGTWSITLYIVQAILYFK